jgi:Spy/CpxP family protein refolding chaperone
MDSINQQLRSSMRELRQAYQNGTFNKALASQKLVEVAPLKAKLMAERFKMHQEMLALLTPEQKSQLDQMRSQFKAKRAEQGGNS